WILVSLQPGLHVCRRSWSRHKADAHTNHHARREPLRFSLQATERLIVALGSELDVPLCPHDIRFTLESRHSRCKKKCPLCAKSGGEQPQQASRLFHRQWWRSAEAGPLRRPN